MKTTTYYCSGCFKWYSFDEDNSRESYICPICNEELMYLSTEEIEPNTNKVINSYIDEKRKAQNPGKPRKTIPIITCPYCKSTNCKKISAGSKAANVLLRGIYAIGYTSKQWHCDNCNSDF